MTDYSDIRDAEAIAALPHDTPLAAVLDLALRGRPRVREEVARFLRHPTGRAHTDDRVDR